MLGRLFSSANSTATSPSGTRPSTAVALEGDDIYTRTLLYPDTSILSHSIKNAFSGSGYSSVSSISSDGCHIEIDCTRDIRVVIAQEGCGAEAKVVIYDSKPALNNIVTLSSSPPLPPPPNIFHPLDECAPPSPVLGGGAGGYGRRRRSPTPFHPSYPSQNATSAITSEDELKVLTDCMFGSISLSYKGPSTKLHILPSFQQPDRVGINTPASEAKARSMRNFSSPVFTSANPNPFPHQGPPSKERRSVMITRLFSVVIPPGPTVLAPSSRDYTPTPASSVGSSNGFPFPRMPTISSTIDNSNSNSKILLPPKTSMYAIGLIISLPQSPSASTIIRRCPNCWSSQYDPELRRRSVDFCCDIAASSVDDELRTDTILVEGGADAGITDDQMDLITRHWDVITRALSELQTVTQQRILEVLQASGLMSPLPPQIGYKYRRRVELRPGALMYDETMKLEIERFKWRIVSGIKIPRVATGQGRWTVWRDEARWINKRCGAKEQNFFFLTLLTAFLGHHTEWLDVLGPHKHRRQHQQQTHTEEFIMSTRTVILSNDKITARRLIYLLSAFLPARNIPTLPQEPVILASRNSMSNIISQSPPAMPYMRKGSIKRKPRRRRSRLSMTHPENDDVRGWDIPVDGHTTNNGSDSIDSAESSSLQLPSAVLGSVRKSNAVVFPTPVATIASKDSDPQQKESRPGSSGSSASFSLMHTLKRSGTGHTSTDSSGTGTSGWGSFLSSIWSNPKSSSTTATSEASTHLDDGLDCIPTRASAGRQAYAEKFEEEMLVGEQDLYDDFLPIQSPPQYDRSFHQFHRPSLSVVDTPLSVSVGEDGVVDVEIALDPAITIPHPSELGASSTINCSPLASPSSVSRSFSLLSLDRSSIHSASTLPSGSEVMENIMSVGGWMEDERFHPDFALQAVRPYYDVEADIKRAMRAEQSPSIRVACASKDANCPNKWFTVCSVLIADARTFRIKRLRLKRRKRDAAFSLDSEPTAVGAIRVQYYTRTDYQGNEEDEAIEEEWVMDIDDTLATAVERALGITNEMATTLSKKGSATAPNVNTTTANILQQHYQQQQQQQQQQQHQYQYQYQQQPKISIRSTGIPGASGRDISPGRVEGTPLSKTKISSGSDCKLLVLGALEEVVKKCAMAGNSKNTDKDKTGKTGNPQRFVENVLTEGVMKWLNDVETC